MLTRGGQRGRERARKSERERWNKKGRERASMTWHPREGAAARRKDKEREREQER